jgi:phosphate transport system substrate-binding protein
LPPSQSESTIAGVKEGLLDLGSISKQLTPEELGDKLAYREIAKDALLVATHPSVTGVNNLTTENLKGIYSGAITNWKQIGGPDAKIIVLDRPEDESTKRLLRKYYLGEQLKNSPTAVIMRQEPDLIAAIGTNPYSIGAFSLAYAIFHQLPANRLSLNGIAPTPENVRSNKYQMIRTIGIVSAKIPSEASQEYIDFALSREGREILNKSGFVPSVK